MANEYNAKVAILEREIADATATIESNKTELNGAISALTVAYEAKMLQINTLLTTLQNTDIAQDEKIAKLASQIIALEQATRITDIQFANNGDLIITFGDGSTQTVQAPEKHVHTFGEWVSFTQDEEISCEGRLFYRICSDCNDFEWKQGEYVDHDWDITTTLPTCQEQGYDTNNCNICGKIEINNYTPITGHSWEIEYSASNSCHWHSCTTCDEINNLEEHSDDGTGLCSICSHIIGPTPGVIYSVADGTASVIGYEGMATSVYIADTYNNVPVTHIAKSAFRYSNVINVIIPDSITSIAYLAFDNCDSLTSVVIPGSVTSFETFAFSNCDNLTSVTINHGVPVISNRIFSNCANLTNVVIPNSVTAIAYGAFEGCTSLTNITLPNSITSIDSSAFEGCSNLTKVVIPDSVTSIKSAAFKGCTRLKEITLPFVGSSKNAVEEEGVLGYIFGYKQDKYVVSDATLQYSNSRESFPYFYYYIPASLKKVTITGDTLGTKAFYNCSNVTDVLFSNKVTCINNEAFYLFTGLTSITIPDSITSIGSSAFEGCRSLTSIKIPDSVTSVGSAVFRRCTNLTSVVIGNGATSIGDYMFDECHNLKSVVIGHNTSSIGEYAFSGCSSLTEIYYYGTPSEWWHITMSDSLKSWFNARTRYYYSETQPTSLGNYWHYDTDGITPVVWIYANPEE